MSAIVNPADVAAAAREMRRAAIGVRLNRYIPHDPTPKQIEALRLDDMLEVFYGGAAGGGKSDWLASPVKPER
jgi:hypothetical protein